MTGMEASGALFGTALGVGFIGSMILTLADVPAKVQRALWSTLAVACALLALPLILRLFMLALLS